MLYKFLKFASIYATVKAYLTSERTSE